MSHGASKRKRSASPAFVGGDDDSNCIHLDEDLAELELSLLLEEEEGVDSRPAQVCPKSRRGGGGRAPQPGGAGCHTHQGCGAVASLSAAPGVARRAILTGRRIRAPMQAPAQPGPGASTSSAAGRPRQQPAPAAAQPAPAAAQPDKPGRILILFDMNGEPPRRGPLLLPGWLLSWPRTPAPPAPAAPPRPPPPPAPD